jgi:hypothetical protein
MDVRRTDNYGRGKCENEKNYHAGHVFCGAHICGLFLSEAPRRNGPHEVEEAARAQEAEEFAPVQLPDVPSPHPPFKGLCRLALGEHQQERRHVCSPPEESPHGYQKRCRYHGRSLLAHEKDCLQLVNS